MGNLTFEDNDRLIAALKICRTGASVRVLILAGRAGTRISRYLSGKPKCTVDIGNGLCLIQYTVELLKNRGIDRIGIAAGLSVPGDTRGA